MSSSARGRKLGWLLLTGIIGATAQTNPASAEKRFFTVLAVEPKGSTTIEKELFPSGPLPPGGGYLLSQPDEKTGRWEVSAYVWQPSQIIVYQGDEVTLEFVGVNGAMHPTTIAGLERAFTLRRGESHRLTFVADKIGSFGVVCSTHRPSMTGEIVVLPRR